MRIRNQECMTTMVWVEVDNAEHDREITEENDKIDHKCQAGETKADPG